MLGVFECVERCHNLDAYGNNPSNASRNIQHMLGYQLLACEWNPFSLTQNLLHFLIIFLFVKLLLRAQSKHYCGPE